MLLNGQYVLDLPGGRTRTIGGVVDSSLDATPYGWSPSNDIVSGGDGSRIYGRIDRCEKIGLRQVDCVAARDADGNEILSFRTGETVRSGVHESPDGTMLAFVVYVQDFDTKALRVTDRAGNVLSDGLYEGGSSTTFSSSLVAARVTRSVAIP